MSNYALWMLAGEVSWLDLSNIYKDPTYLARVEKASPNSKTPSETRYFWVVQFKGHTVFGGFADSREKAKDCCELTIDHHEMMGVMV